MKKLALLLLPIVTILSLGLTALPVHAQQTEQLCKGAGGTFNPDDGSCSRAGEVGLFDEGGLFRNIVNVLIFLVGVISVIMLIVGAIRYATSAGDANAVNGAKNTILYAIVGIVIAAASFAIVNFVINQLNTNP